MTDALETRVARIEALLGLHADDDLRPIAAIVQDAAASYGLRPDQATGPSRRTAAVHARRAAVWTAHHLYPATSLRVMARMMGHADHTTILNALRRAETQRDLDPDFRRRTDDLVRAAQERMTA